MGLEPNRCALAHTDIEARRCKSDSFGEGREGLEACAWFAATRSVCFLAQGFVAFECSVLHLTTVF